MNVNIPKPYPRKQNYSSLTLFKLINMENILIIHILSNHVAANNKKMRKIILKLHKLPSSVAFFKNQYLYSIDNE